MLLRSTRNIKDPVSFEQAIFQGLAPDGGLYHPLKFNSYPELFASMNSRQNFQTIAASFIRQLLCEEVNPDDIQALAEKAFPFSPVLKELEKNLFVLELFHGPSCAFKDYGASFLATMMEYFLKKEKKRAIILTATSGDTGSAVARAFLNKENIEVVILYPSGRVSPLQEKQLTTSGHNIHALEVQGNFDDCQKMVKEAFTSKELQTLPLTSANSINMGRLLPQSFYYAYAYAQLKESLDKQALRFCVPSGNFGNLTAGLYAWKWGLPAHSFIAATNANDVIPQYLLQGKFIPRPSVATASNAMDVGNPSNFERMEALFHSDIQEMRKTVSGYVVNDKLTLDTIQKVQSSWNYMMDPHTAVGFHAIQKYRSESSTLQDKIVLLSTAHPAKFNEIMEQACGEAAPLPARLQEVARKKKESIVIENTFDALRDYLLRSH